MKEIELVINQGGVKRRIAGPFEICVGRETLQVLLERLHEAAGVEVILQKNNWNFGWIKIFDEPEIESVPNSTPLPWV